MAKLYASPAGGRHLYDGADRATTTFQQAIDQAQPGDEILLLPGVYDVPVTIKGKQAGDNPIRVRGDTRATLDGRRSVLRPPDTIKSAGSAAGGIDIFSMIHVEDSAGIVLDNLVIQNAWPVAISIARSARMVLRRINFNGSTVAVLAWGKQTRELLVESCSWIQDDRIWQQVLWSDIHGNPRPRKELDGDFFRSFDIAGTCVFRKNYIANAFNGIQLFANEAAKPGEFNADVWIYRNTFSLIRDNAVEAEYTARNWWVYENIVYNCHKWFAFEECNGGFLYLFSNRGWFDRKPGPPGDCSAGGSVFKASAIDKEVEADRLPGDPTYVFHNSWYLRSAYLKDGKLKKFNHFNNAIEYADATRHHPGVCDPDRKMIGEGAFDPICTDPGEEREFFTKEWDRLEIKFWNDACNHRDYVRVLNLQGYPVLGVSGLPGFVSGRSGNFAPTPGALATGRSAAHAIALPSGGNWDLPEKRNLGAVEFNAKKKPVAMTPARLGCPPAMFPAEFFHGWMKPEVALGQ